MKNTKVLYVGPTGLNPELGLVETGNEILCPDSLCAKYKGLKYIKDIKPISTEPKKTKSNKKEED